MKTIKRYLLYPLCRLLRFWRKLLPVRLIVRVLLMLVGLSSNVQAQQLQIENMYARLRYNTCFLREGEENTDRILTEGK